MLRALVVFGSALVALAPFVPRVDAEVDAAVDGPAHTVPAIAVENPVIEGPVDRKAAHGKAADRKAVGESIEIEDAVEVEYSEAGAEYIEDENGVVGNAKAGNAESGNGQV